LRYGWLQSVTRYLACRGLTSRSTRTPRVRRFAPAPGRRLPSFVRRPTNSPVRRLMNRWNIPDWLEREVIERDRYCVYCGVEFVASTSTRRHSPSWEHIVNDARVVTPQNIARCCISCNASKGRKDLAEWLQSSYCRTRGITVQSVAAVVKAALSSRSGTHALGA
jgi:5-methylcytosine-specific restriction endonuclease McrA